MIRNNLVCQDEGNKGFVEGRANCHQLQLVLKDMITYFEKYELMIDHRSYVHNLSSCEIKPEKNSALNGIRTHDL